MALKTEECLARSIISDWSGVKKITFNDWSTNWMVSSSYFDVTINGVAVMYSLPSDMGNDETCDGSMSDSTKNIQD